MASLFKSENSLFYPIGSGGTETYAVDDNSGSIISEEDIDSPFIKPLPTSPTSQNSEENQEMIDNLNKRRGQSYLQNTDVVVAEQEIIEIEGYKDLKQSFLESGKQDEFFNSRKEKIMKSYQEQFRAAKELGNTKKMKALNTAINNLQGSIKKHNDNVLCTFDLAGEGCSEGSINLLDDLSESLTVNNLKQNEHLLRSIQRTNGGVNKDGSEKTTNELLSEWAADQQYFAYNFGNMALQATDYWKGMTDEEKRDTALQWTYFQKVKGREEEGGLNNSESWRNIGIAIATDPTNYIGFGLVANIFKVGLKATGSKVGQEATKKGLGMWLKKHAKTKAALTTAPLGAVYTGLDSAANQQILTQSGLQDNYDWGMSGIGGKALLGFGFGGGLGFGVAGFSELFTNIANKHIIRNNLTNKEFLDNMSKNVTDKASLKRWLKTIGWERPEVKAELELFKQDGYVVPSNPKNTEELLLGKQSKDEFNIDIKKDDVGANQAEIEQLKVVANQDLVPNEQIKNSRQVDKNAEILQAREKLALVDDYDALVYDEVAKIDIQQPFTKWGYNVFNRVSTLLSDKVGTWAARSLYGNDALLVNSGARGLAEAISGANVTVDMNVAKFGDAINTYVKKHSNELGDLNKLIDDGLNKGPITNVQKGFIDLIKVRKNKVLSDAYKAGVIDLKQLTKFKNDASYIPRVWNSQKLLTTKGSAEFAAFLSAKTKGKTIAQKEKLIDAITGNKELTKEILDSKISPQSIKNTFQRKTLDGLNVKRSSHLENERKLFKNNTELERELDPFMAPAADRWVSFFADTIKRNEYAKRFGAKDEKVTKLINKLKMGGSDVQKRQAANIQEVYFTQVGDAKLSKALAASVNNPKVARAVAKANAIQNHKLGLAAIPNATQSFVNGTVLLAKSGNLLTAPFRAVSAIVRAIVKTKKDQKIVYNTGVMGDMDLSRIATENAANARIIDKEFRGILKILNEPTSFLRAVGFMSVEKMNRRAGAIMSYGHVTTLHSKLQKLQLEGKLNSFRGIKLQRELKELGIGDPLKANLTELDYAVSGHMFNKQINFSGESGNLPVNWSKPWFKLMTKFKSFMFYQARFLKRNVSDELFINKNPAPLVAYLVAGGFAGNGVELTRALLSGKTIEENRNALELLISGVGHAGGWGLFFDTLKDVDEGRGLSAFTGPTVSDVVDTADDLLSADIDNIILRMTPNIPGKGYLKEAWRSE